MNLVVRRRLAVSALAASSALVAGVLIAPSSNAATGGLTISPSGAVNTDTVKLTFTGTDADFEFGGSAVFSRINGGQNFTVNMDSDSPPRGKNTKQTATVNFADPDGAATSPDGGVGKDGPADAGVYNVSATGAAAPVPGNPLAPGGGNDTCPSCFTVIASGPVAVSGATPTSLRPNATQNITIAGNNFERGTRIDFLFSDGSVDPLITANANPKDANGKDIVDKITTRTSLKRTAHVDSSDAPGARGIRVTNLDGSTASCTSCFFVAGPALTSISPTSGVNDPGGAPVTITFTGPNVTNGTPRLEFTGDPGSSTRDALSLDPTSSTQSNGQSLQGTFDLQNAAPGSYQAVVRDKNTGITNACEAPCSVFTVLQRSTREPPTVSSLSDTSNPGSHSQPAGTTRVFEVNGTNFSKGVAIKTTAAKTTVTAVEFVSSTLVRATIVTAKDETSGNYDVTATLTDGSTSAACKGCYTVAATPSPTPSSSKSASPSGSASPCPSSSGSATPSSTSSATASSTASATASSTASATASAAASSTGSPSATASSTASPSATASVTPSSSTSATPTATTSPSGKPSCGKPLTLTLDSADVITPGTHSLMTATGTPNAAVILRCYSRTPENGNQSSPPYSDARNNNLDASGEYQFSLNPGTNTRCFVKYAGSSDSDANASTSVVQKVATALSLSSYRDGVRKYHFQGTNLPRRAGQLITLYRYASASGGYCRPAPEHYGSANTTGSCRAIRTATATTNANNVWRIDRTFSGNGQFYFVVRTSDNLTNVGGFSNQRLTVIR